VLDKRISLSFVDCFLRLELSSYTGGVVATLARAAEWSNRGGVEGLW
jgi:hypothetical protein